MACEAAASADRLPGSGTVAMECHAPLLSPNRELQQTVLVGLPYFVDNQFFANAEHRPHSRRACVAMGNSG